MLLYYRELRKSAGWSENFSEGGTILIGKQLKTPESLVY